MKDITQYQEFTSETAIYPDKDTGNEYALMFCALGLVSETGEVANKIKKIYRDGLHITDEMRYEIVKEVGDAAWYLVRLIDELGFTADYVLGENVRKLRDRAERGVLSGNGDNR